MTTLLTNLSPYEAIAVTLAETVTPEQLLPILMKAQTRMSKEVDHHQWRNTTSALMMVCEATAIGDKQPHSGKAVPLAQ